MPARIPLILSQPARRDAVAVDLIENIVAAAMLVPGLDANLVGDIDTFDLGGTDHLCLQGHTRDVVLASFLELSAAQAAWQRLGQSGHFVDFTSSEEKIRSSLRSVTAVRKVFYFRLVPHQPVTALLDRCQQLLAAQQLSLVSIRIGPAGSSQSPAVPLPTVNSVKLATPIPRSIEPASAAIGPIVQSNSSIQSSAIDSEIEDWSELDKLVDDLDAMDL